MRWGHVVGCSVYKYIYISWHNNSPNMCSINFGEKIIFFFFISITHLKYIKSPLLVTGYVAFSPHYQFWEYLFRYSWVLCKWNSLKENFKRTYCPNLFNLSIYKKMNIPLFISTRIQTVLKTKKKLDQSDTDGFIC